MFGTRKLKLGDRVRDIYTGFEGTLVARTEWLHGCDRLTIEPTKLKGDGGVMDSITFDAGRVELVRQEEVRLSRDEQMTKTGGPNGPPPDRARDPR